MSRFQPFFFRLPNTFQLELKKTLWMRGLLLCLSTVLSQNSRPIRSLHPAQHRRRRLLWTSLCQDFLSGQAGKNILSFYVTFWDFFFDGLVGKKNYFPGKNFILHIEKLIYSRTLFYSFLWDNQFQLIVLSPQA